MSDEIKKRFLGDIANHSMKILCDDGVRRHLRFSRGEGYIYLFDLITWPGHLCITGDNGTFVFSRIADMFEFFEREELAINRDYWSEKVLAADRDGIRKYSPEKFKQRVMKHYESWKKEEPDEELAAAVLDAIKGEVLVCAENGENAAYEAVHLFQCKDFMFQDFFDGGGTEDYTYTFTWCCYAIVWGIQQYRAAK